MYYTTHKKYSHQKNLSVTLYEFSFFKIFIYSADNFFLFNERHISGICSGTQTIRRHTSLGPRIPPQRAALPHRGAQPQVHPQHERLRLP